MDKQRAQSSPNPVTGTTAEVKERSTATEKEGVGKTGTQPEGVGLASSFGALGQAAKEVIKEGPAGPQNLEKMVYEGRTMERGE